MKKNFARIIIVMLLVLSTLLTTTSCFFFEFEGFVDDFFSEEDPFDRVYPDPVLPDQGNPDTGNDPTLPDGDVDYYPTEGNPEDATALNRTLLSTVIVASEFGEEYSIGAGVIYKLDKEKGDAYIITNFHVVYDAAYGISKDILLYAYGMELSQYVIPATCLGGSISYDIAVLKVTDSEVIKNSHLTTVSLGDSDSIDVFDRIYTVGNPKAEGIAACQGIISVVSEYLELTGADNTTIELRVIRVDAAVNSGNSGGGLYDENGKLIGIVCAKRIGSDVDNMGYAIPVNLAVNLAENIIANCDGISKTQVNRVLLGIEITAQIMGIKIDPETGDIDRVAVVEVSNVFDYSPLFGQLEKGDQIISLSINGEAITPTQIYHITDYMFRARIGDTVTTTVLRGDEQIDFTITVTPDCITLVK